jgi:hypothetical protein
MKLLISIIFLVGLSAPPAPPASAPACYCLIPDVPKAVEASAAVFLGEVVEVVPPRASGEGAPVRERFHTIKFKVEKSWKGEVSGQVGVLSAQSNESCFIYLPFKKGDRYLVYAGETSPEGSARKGDLIITACNRTALVPEPGAAPGERLLTPGVNRQDASKDLKELETAKAFPGFRPPKQREQ